MNASELREAFLSYFEMRGHSRVVSAPLIPRNDPTLFFVNAGMVQFKNFFTGAEHPPFSRAASSQKCLRVSGKHNDLENVGFTARHHTFFEMLGNFSFGDYFKEEAIEFAWSFLTEELKLPADRLLVTVHYSDDEAFDLWVKRGVAPERIARCGDKDNFWSMGDTGPCGPCTEIFWDLGKPEKPSGRPDPWGFGQDEDRYVEVWNNVFMQFERHADGSQTKLPKPSVDTGMGLERLAAVMIGADSNYHSSLFTPLMKRAAELIGTSYEQCTEQQIPSLRVIADHARAAVFLIADGIVPSNEGRGYVLRRVMRRAIRHGVKIGISDVFLHQVADRVIDIMEDAYPELRERRDFIEKACISEERSFRETLDRGLELIEKASAGGSLKGETVFVLHDTYGFPPDLTQVIASERGLAIDMPGYESLMDEQRARARAAHKGSGEEAEAVAVLALGAEFPATEFLGYEGTQGAGKVLAILKNGRRVERLEAGDSGWFVSDKSPFYGESGGQVGDTGRALFGSTELTVLDTQKTGQGHLLHKVLVDLGKLKVGDVGDLHVDDNRRAAIKRNHTATHLLHAALRRVLGKHVTQQGSVVYPDRLRFDFWHMNSLTDAEIQAVEDDVNRAVLSDLATHTRQGSYDQAVADGVMALFGEKYGDVVRIVDVPGVSTELCGGTHCRSTGEIGLVKIVSETGVAANVRRINAVSGTGVVEFIRQLERERMSVADALNAKPSELLVRATKLTEERKQLARELDETKLKLLAGGSAGQAKAFDFGDVRAHVENASGIDPKILREHADRCLERLGQGVVVLGTTDGDSARLLIKVSKDLTKRIHAGKIIGEAAILVDGKGGGRPDMAEAGGKNPGGLQAALDRAAELIGLAAGT